MHTHITHTHITHNTHTHCYLQWNISTDGVFQNSRSLRTLKNYVIKISVSTHGELLKYKLENKTIPQFE